MWVKAADSLRFIGKQTTMPQVELVEKRFRNFVHTRAFQELGFHLMKKRKIDEDLYFKQLAHNIRNRVLVNLVINKLAVLKEGRLKNAIAYLLKPGNIEDTHIPFACNATDLISGRPYLFTHGDIRKAVQASSAIPGIFPPLKLNGKLFSDGAIIFNIPVPFARALGADYVIAVITTLPMCLMCFFAPAILPAPIFPKKSSKKQIWWCVPRWAISTGRILSTRKKSWKKANRLWKRLWKNSAGTG